MIHPDELNHAPIPTDRARAGADEAATEAAAVAESAVLALDDALARLQSTPDGRGYARRVREEARTVREAADKARVAAEAAELADERASDRYTGSCGDAAERARDAARDADDAADEAESNLVRCPRCHGEMHVDDTTYVGEIDDETDSG